MTRSRIEPVAIGDAKLEREPVRKIDEILVLDHAAGNVGAQPVVAAGEVGSRIVNVIRRAPRRRPARREIAIPQGAQGFADSLPRRVESFVHQRPRRRRLYRDLDLRQIGHHDIGAGLAQRLRVPAAIDADDAAESAGAPRLRRRRSRPPRRPRALVRP